MTLGARETIRRLPGDEAASCGRRSQTNATTAQTASRMKSRRGLVTILLK